MDKGVVNGFFLYSIFVILMGGLVYAVVAGTIAFRDGIKQADEIFASASNITIKKATIDSPVIMILVDTPQQLIEIANSEGNSIIYQLAPATYATIANSTIGYKYSVHAEQPLWWIWG